MLIYLLGTWLQNDGLNFFSLWINGNVYPELAVRKYGTR
jgi:hypothetical protein